MTHGYYMIKVVEYHSEADEVQRLFTVKGFFDIFYDFLIEGC